MGDPLPANSHDIKTSLHLLANAHSNVVSGSEEKEKSVDGGNKEMTTFDSNKEDFAEEKTEKSSGMYNNLDDDK